MNYKKIVSLILITLITVSLFGCGSQESASGTNNAEDTGKVTIRFINGFTGGDGEYMKKITEAFNNSQDQFYVEELQEKEHYIKFKSDNFDLVVMHGNNLSTYVQDGLLREMDDIYDKAGISINDFHAVGKKLVERNGKLYGIPLDIHPLTMFYNKKLVSETPTTYEDLLKINEELQKRDTNLYATGIPNSGLVEFMIFTIAAQDRVNLLEDGHLKFDTPELAKSLMKYHDMIWKDKISPKGLGLDGEFQAFMKESKENSAVQTAIAFTGPWFYGAVKEKYGDDLGIGEIPKLGSNKGVYGNSHLISVSSKVKDEKKIEAIAAYLKFMFTPENLINWAAAGQAPLHKATMDLISQNKDKYELAFYNQKQFDSFVQAPDVYQFGEQVRYMNENVFNLLVSTENLTMDQLMSELKIATEIAEQVSKSGQ